MSEKIDTKSVRRNNLRYAHRYILDRPSLAFFLSVLSAGAAVALYLNLVGHSDWKQDWQVQNKNGSYFLSGISILFLIYFILGRLRLKKK